MERFIVTSRHSQIAKKAYDCITDWLALEFKREEERKAIIELKRFTLSKTRDNQLHPIFAQRPQRLICTGKTPSLDKLLNAVAKTHRRYHNQIIAARKIGRKRD